MVDFIKTNYFIFGYVTHLHIGLCVNRWDVEHMEQR